jgi:hypothetical protein
MNFIKKNYEKILLGAVLLGLFGAVLLLPVVIAADKAALKAIIASIVETPPKPLPPLDMSSESNVLVRIQSPYTLDLKTTNRLFNPMRWQKTPDGRLIEIINGSVVGIEAVKITNIKPLYFTLKLSSIDAANQFSAARYVISIQRQGASNPALRSARDTYISVGEKNGTFLLVSANGSADNPQLVLQMNDSGETINLSKGQTYQSVDGYMADLTYPPLNKKWDNSRVGDPLKNIDGDDYIIVVIDTNEVVVSAQSNQKKTTLPYQP